MKKKGVLDEMCVRFSCQEPRARRLDYDPGTQDGNKRDLFKLKSYLLFLTSQYRRATPKLRMKNC